jgi:hypothetical protein
VTEDSPRRNERPAPANDAPKARRAESQASTSRAEDGAADEVAPAEPGQQPGRPWGDGVQPYLRRLAERIRRQGPKDHSISLPIGDNRLLINPAEQRLLADLGGDPASIGARDLMLADSLGLQTKVYASVRKIAKDDEPRKGVYRTRLSVDRDSCYALSRQLTIEIRRLRESEAAGAADPLQESRNQLNKAIETAEDVIGTRTSELASRAPSDTQFTYDWQAIASTPGASAAPRREPPAAAKPRDRKRELRLYVVLGVAVFVLFAILLNLWLNRPRQLQDFAAGDFPEVPGIQQVVNRSPNLIIVVDDAAWNTAPSFEKRKALEKVGVTIKSAGYKKAEVRSRTRAYLAVWDRSGRVRVGE